MRLRPAFTRLLVVLLLLQWGTAFSHCLKLAPAQQVLHLDICTPDGLRSLALVLEDQGEDHGAPSPKHAAGMFCPVCGALGGAALPPPAVSVLPPRMMLLVAQPAAPPIPNLAPAPRRLPPTRAPPAT